MSDPGKCVTPFLFLRTFQSYLKHLIKIFFFFFLELCFDENFSVHMHFTGKLVSAVPQPFNQQVLVLCPTEKDSPGSVGLEL